MKKPDLNTVPEWYRGYIQAVPELDLLDTLTVADQTFREVIMQLSEDQLEVRYEAGKWSIKDIILHLSDAERVFAYRALRIARGDQTIMHGYDHNQYVISANADQRIGTNLLSEYKAVRQATVALFESFVPEELSRSGMVDQNAFTPSVLGYVIAGHQLHHTDILKERYLPKINI